MSTPTTSNLVWHSHGVTRTDRTSLNGHRPCVLWFTGLSGSGKSTLAGAVEEALYRRGIHTYLLDGDNVRHGLNGDLGFGVEARKENIRRIGEVAKLFVDAGVVTLAAFISPFRADRDRVRALLSPGEFMEIHVKAELAVCETRDPKGLYRKARAGEISDFTGISSPYEEPKAPEVVVNTGHDELATCVEQVLAHGKGLGIW